MAEQKNKKVEEQIDNKPIDGQMEIAPEDTAELKVVDETADTVKLEMPNGEQVDVDKESLDDLKKYIREQRGIDEDATTNTSIIPECGGIVGIDKIAEKHTKWCVSLNPIFSINCSCLGHRLACYVRCACCFNGEKICSTILIVNHHITTAIFPAIWWVCVWLPQSSHIREIADSCRSCLDREYVK